MQVEHNDQSLSLPLIVTMGDGPTLLGRDWLLLLRLDWHNIFRVDTTSHTLEDILEKHGKIFQDGLGTLYKEYQPSYTLTRTFNHISITLDWYHLPYTRRS